MCKKVHLALTFQVHAHVGGFMYAHVGVELKSLKIFQIFTVGIQNPNCFNIQTVGSCLVVKWFGFVNGSD